MVIRVVGLPFGAGPTRHVASLLLLPMITIICFSGLSEGVAYPSGPDSPALSCCLLSTQSTLLHYHHNSRILLYIRAPYGGIPATILNLRLMIIKQQIGAPTLGIPIIRTPEASAYQPRLPTACSGGVLCVPSRGHPGPSANGRVIFLLRKDVQLTLQRSIFPL